MMDVTVLARAVELAEARCGFVLATVVWRRGPSSGRAGSKAIVLPDGAVCGWLGGACAEPSVVRHALECMQTGEPALLLLGRPGEFDQRDREGARLIAMACESDGALEVYLEPHRPQPQVIVVGRSPAVDALAEMAETVGWQAVVIDDGGDPNTHTRPHLVRTKLDFDSVVIDRATAVVIATQGHYDDLALAAALQAGADRAGYVGLVASPRRATAVIDHLREQFTEDHPHLLASLSGVHAPAGVDLGSLPNAEIAVAVMADLVARRARGELSAHPAHGVDATAAPERREAIDPVCEMTVLVHDAKYHTVHDGSDYWFCASGCLRAFVANPEAFV